MEDKRLKILLIEDNSKEARLVEELLAEPGAASFQLEWVERLSKGLERLEEEEVDVLLLDLSLPECQGLSTLLELQAHEPELPIVILTGENDDELALRAVQEGAQDYLVKGQLTSGLLVRSLRYAIERQKLMTIIKGLSRDPLTGLYNYSSFCLLAEHQMDVARRAQSGLWLIFIEVKGLRYLNGHFDPLDKRRALSKIGRVLEKSFRDTDIIARLRQDEFAVLTVDDAENSAEVVKSRLLKHLDKFNDGNDPLRLSLLVGTAHFDREKTFCIGELLAIADKAMFEAQPDRLLCPSSVT